MRNLILIFILIMAFGLAGCPAPSPESKQLFDGHYVKGYVYAKAKDNEIGLLSINLDEDISKLIFFKADKDSIHPFENLTTDHDKVIYFSIEEKDSILWAKGIVTLKSNIPKGKEPKENKVLIDEFPTYGFVDYHKINGQGHKSDRHRAGHINSAKVGATSNLYEVEISILDNNNKPSKEAQIYYTDDENIYTNALILKDYDGAWIDFETRNGHNYLLDVSKCHNHIEQGLFCYKLKS